MEDTETPTEWTAEVCYGELRHREQFRTKVPDLKAGDQCVIRTDRGVEVGSLVTNPLPAEPSEAEIPEPSEENDDDGDGDGEGGGEILRLMNADDEARVRELAGNQRKEAFAHCRERIAARELPMRLVQIEQMLGGNRMIFYFTAPRRIDFRDLVRDLSRRFRTRIELRQIGARDEARVLGDDEMCGRELCCRGHMRELKPVTMKMAKNQKTTLDPARISGRCGRLMCCLRHEDEAYTHLRRNLPRNGTEVKTLDGIAKVVKMDILRQCVDCRLEGGRRITLTCAELEDLGKAENDARAGSDEKPSES
jgi:cell fate regulator YaaT (PSP1 superfamily)